MKSKTGFGCGPIIAVVVMIFVIIVIYDIFFDNHIQVKDGIAYVERGYLGGGADTAASVAWGVAYDAHKVAIKYPDVHQIVVNIHINPELLRDKYGNKIRGNVHMGTITINDVSEIRKYTEGAYIGEMEPVFAVQIMQMPYANYLKRQ